MTNTRITHRRSAHRDAYPAFLRRRRHERGMTQQTISALMGQRQSNYSAVENSVTWASADFAVAAARALGDDPLEHLVELGVLTREEARIPYPAAHAGADEQWIKPDDDTDSE